MVFPLGWKVMERDRGGWNGTSAIRWSRIRCFSETRPGKNGSWACQYVHPTSLRWRNRQSIQFGCKGYARWSAAATNAYQIAIAADIGFIFEVAKVNELGPQSSEGEPNVPVGWLADSGPGPSHPAIQPVKPVKPVKARDG